LIKCIVLDVNNAVGHRNIGQARAKIEVIAPDDQSTIGKCGVPQVRAEFEEPASVIRNGAIDRDIGQAVTVTERSRPYAGHTIGNRNVGQIITPEERSGPDADETGKIRDTGQITIFEGVGSEDRDATGISYARQRKTIIKCPIANISHACGNCHRTQRGALVEGVASDAGDRIAVGCVGYDYHSARAGIARDSNRPIISREVELGFGDVQR